MFARKEKTFLWKLFCMLFKIIWCKTFQLFFCCLRTLFIKKSALFMLFILCSHRMNIKELEQVRRFDVWIRLRIGLCGNGYTVVHIENIYCNFKSMTTYWGSSELAILNVINKRQTCSRSFFFIRRKKSTET